VLENILTEKAIRLKARAVDWQEAVRMGGELLVNAGFAKPSYIEAMVETVKQLGPYSVIAPGIAMPHARPEAGVIKPGLSLVTLANHWSSVTKRTIRWTLWFHSVPPITPLTYRCLQSLLSYLAVMML